MQSRKFIVVTQLHEKNNRCLIEYTEASRRDYGKALREAFYAIRHGGFNKAWYKTYLQNKYRIVSRTANSIIFDAQGRFNALRALKEYEKKQLERKIKHLGDTVIPKLVAKRNQNSIKLQDGVSVSLSKQRNLRLRVVAKKSKLNRLKQKLKMLEYQLKSGRLRICFGTKRLLKQDREKFIEQRDSQMTFIGAKEETACNQVLQLKYNRRSNQFLIRLRKDFGDYKLAKGEDRYVYGKVYFNHYKGQLVSILRSKASPLSYKIVKRKGRYYLYCTFEFQVGNSDIVTRSSYGTVGLDFNKGFVTLSETNQYGHLVQTAFMSYRFKSGSKTKTDLQDVANHVVKIALRTGKDVCIENLDFRSTKAKTETNIGKKYNEMLHSLAYREFSEAMESVAYRNRVELHKVNPAWTSWLADRIYCKPMKLNIHTGASYVIARRGQGYKDAV
jgi:transposase, IS605 orfB family